MMNYADCHGLFGMDFMGGGMWLYGIVFLLIVLLIAYLINNNHNIHKVTALETLDKEYAKGNITHEDYLKRKDNLKG